MTSLPARSDLAGRVAALAPWYQQIAFPDGTIVGGWQTETLCDVLFEGRELAGLSAVDVGAMSGAASRWLEGRGASVTATDVHPRCLAQLRLVREAFGLNYAILDHDIEASPPPEADVVLMAGVCYHLRHPLRGLDNAWAATRRLLVVESEVGPGEGSVALFCGGDYRGDSTVWWVPTRGCLLAWARSLPEAGEVTGIAMNRRERYAVVVRRYG